jgi:hypothetical protein
VVDADAKESTAVRGKEKVSMASSEYRFKPMTAFCLLFMVLCQCLLPANAPAVDPEFARVVPDLYGKTVAQAGEILENRGLQIGDVHHARSRSPVGTIVRQEPEKGSETAIGRNVAVWVAQGPLSTRPVRPPQSPAPASPPSLVPPPQLPPEQLHAEIRPLSLEVRQGEPAVFTSRSSPRDGIREVWRGPLNQRSTGEGFEVGTADLEPGRYSVELDVTNNREQSAHAQATLLVTAPRVPPRTTGPGGEAGPEDASPRYSASITSDLTETRKSQPVTFTAELLPGRRDVSYRFHFGDGTRSETRARFAHHEYGTAGTFEAFVEVLGDHESAIAESTPVVIEVVDAAPPANPPEDKHFPLLPWIGTALSAGLFLGYYLYSRKNETPRSASAPGPRFRAVSRGDAGNRQIDGDLTRFCGPEIGLMPIGDIGRQEIVEQREPIIREERWENE